MHFATGPGRTPGAGPARASRRRGGTILGVLVPALLALLVLSSSASAALQSAGPIDPANNFPSFFKDNNGLALQICQDGPPNCLAGPDPIQDVHAAGGDAEAFYFSADATTTHFSLHDAVEAAYLGAGPDQETQFQRTEIRASALPASTTYEVTDPYGTFKCTTDGTGVIKSTGCRTETAGSVAQAVNGRMGPFLTWDTFVTGGAGAPPAGYIGDNTTPHKVVGSPTGFNAFRVTGPGLTGTCTNADGSTVSNCEQTDQFIVQGKLAPVKAAAVSPGKLDFGNIDPAPAVTKTLTYANTGAENVSISSVTLGGTNATDFAMQDGCSVVAAAPAGLAPGGRCTISVTFTPQAGAASSATLTIADDTSDTPRVIPVVGSNLPVMSIDPGTPKLTFPSTAVSTVSAEDNVVVANNGPAAGTIKTKTIVGTGASHFKLGPNDTCSTPPGAAASGGGCEIGVQFAPTTTGTKSAALRLTDSTGKTLPDVPLSGTGLAANPVASPTVTPASGAYTSAQSVTMSAAAGTTIRYTVGNGVTAPADPTATTGLVYSGPVSVGSSQIIKARAFDASGVASPVVQRDYTINIPPAAPSVTPATGTYTSAQSVTMTAATGTEIRYTIGDGTTVPADPTATTGTVYTGPVSVNASQVIKAAAFNANGTGSTVVQRTYTIAPAAPTVTPAAGTYTSAQSVSMTAATGTTIRYTVGNGTTVPADPTSTTGTVYSGPVSVGTSQVIKARAFDGSGTGSTVVQRAYTINLPAPTVAAPTVSPAGGTFTSAQSVSMTAAAGTTIRYTVGTGTTVPADPTSTTGTLYSGAVNVGSSQIIKARAFDANGNPSTVVQNSYTINLPAPPAALAAPTVTPASGSYTGSVTATMTADPGTTIRYTVGTGTTVPADPTATTGQVYPNGVNTWTASRVVKVAAFDAAGNRSSIVQRNYTITAAPAPTVAAPTVSPAGGTFTSAQSVTMTAATGTTIRYTIGTGTTVPADPTSTTGTLYGGAVNVGSSQVIKARAFDANGNGSTVVQNTYTINAATPPPPTGTDTTAPNLTARTPASNAGGVVGTSTVTATFSEAVQAATVNTTTFTVKTAAGTAVAGTVAYNATTRVATFTPSAALANDTRYNIALTTGVKDVAGNALVGTTAQPLTWTFLTGPRPTVTARTPAVNATAVARTANVTATFSEAVVATGVTGSSVTLQSVSSTGALTAVPATVTYNATTRVATLDPSATLAANQKYRATLVTGGTAIRDIAGNNMSGNVTWDFTTGA